MFSPTFRSLRMSNENLKKESVKPETDMGVNVSLQSFVLTRNLQVLDTDGVFNLQLHLEARLRPERCSIYL